MSLRYIKIKIKRRPKIRQSLLPVDVDLVISISCLRDDGDEEVVGIGGEMAEGVMREELL